MKLSISTDELSGNISAIASKSHLHRLLIVSAFSSSPCKITCDKSTGEDILATIDCLESLGANITSVENGYEVSPVNIHNLPKKAILPCRESGSTLRFMLPIICALGIEGEFHCQGRLPQRPLAPLDDLLTEKGCIIQPFQQGVLRCSGKLSAGEYSIAGNISSQYITGLLFALSLLSENSQLQITGKVESLNYIYMTLDALSQFGHDIPSENHAYTICGGKSFIPPRDVKVQGDWSNSAFWLTAGAMSKSGITVTGLQMDSLQGDKEILNILKNMGADIVVCGDDITVKKNRLQGIQLEAEKIPDLVPIVAALASVCEGETVINKAARLRLKESDRIKAVADALQTLGATLETQEDGFVIHGKPHLKSGICDSQNDHRIAMMCAIISGACENEIIISDAQSVNKSYPHFWADLVTLGKKVEVVHE